MTANKTGMDKRTLVKMLTEALNKVQKPIRIRQFHKGSKSTWFHPDSPNQERSWNYPDSCYDFWYIPIERCIYLKLKTGYGLPNYTAKQNERMRKMTIPNKRATQYSLEEIPKVLEAISEKCFSLNLFTFEVIYEVARTNSSQS